MRTKTILLAAAIFAACLGVSMAQAPVYSVNAVGYVTKNLLPQYNLLANPLNGTNNQVSTIIPVAPEDAYILRWIPATQRFSDPNNFSFGAWDLPGDILNPGEGFFFFNPSTTTNVTFVGEVPQGNVTNHLSANYTLISHIIPQSIGLDAAGVNFPANEDDYVLFWNAATQRFSDPDNYSFSAWDYSPTPAVGEGFFYFTGVPRDWSRAFTVN